MTEKEIAKDILIKLIDSGVLNALGTVEETAKSAVSMYKIIYSGVVDAAKVQ